MNAYPGEVRADLQRFYGLNIDRLGVDFDIYHAGECLARLPLGSTLLAKIEPRLGWTNEEFILHQILSVMAGEKIPFPWDKRSGIEGIETESMPLDQFQDWYENTNWKEVEGWQETL